MRLLARAAAGLRALFHGKRVEQDLDDELRAFIETAVDQKMRSGMSRAEALRAARIELGSAAAVKDHVRDVGWESILESVWQDVRYGVRTLRRSPGFAATVITILALGIGANTAIFSLLNAVMLRTLPVHEPAQLVEPLSRYPGEPHMNGFSWEFYEYVRDRNHVFADVTGFTPTKFKVGRAGGDAETVDAEYVAGNLYSTLGLQPALGRLIGPDDTRAGSPRVAVVSWSYWKSRFNLDPSILGTQIQVNGQPATIVGVTPRAFAGLLPGIVPAVSLPVTRPIDLGLLARLKAGVSIEQARAEMNVLHRFRLEPLAQKSGDPQWLKSTMDLESAATGLSILRDRLGRPLQALLLVVGVTPRAFVGLLPGIMPAVSLPVTRPIELGLLARLKPGLSIEQARAEMNVLHRWRLEGLAAKSGDPQWLKSTMDLESAATGLSILRDRLGRPLQALLLVVGVLLIITCMNVASMVLARGAARRQEMAVRVSLGASRIRLIRHVLTESILLATAGGLLGIGLAYFGAEALLRLLSGRLSPDWPPLQLDLQITPDTRVLLFTTGVALLTGVVFGLAPAWNAITVAPIAALREIGSVGPRKSRGRFGQALVVAQVALSVVLLSAAGLSLAHLSNLRNVDTGFRRDSVLLVRLNAQGSGYNRTQLTGLYKVLLDRLHAIPGVRSATLSAVTPIEGGAASSFATVEGFDEKPETRRRLWQNWVAPRYFETLGTPLVAGRDFQFADAGGPRVAIVNQAMARFYFGAGRPLGRHLTFEGDTVPYEIVGVVGDAKYEDLHEAPPRTVYLNAFQGGRIQSHFALRTDVRPAAVAPQVRRAVEEVLKTVPVEKVTTLDEQVDSSLVLERVVAMLSGSFGTLGACLAAIGLYGLLAYTVTRRTNEIGVRMALGATAGDVSGMVLKGAFGLVVAGLVVGVPLAVASQRFAATLVQGLPVKSVLPIAVASVTMIGIAFLAAYIPARRAARVDPLLALRCD